jgi:rare lipoprotein A
MLSRINLVALSIMAAAFFTQINTTDAAVKKHSKGHIGYVSWYDCRKPGECSKNKITASGARFNPNGHTAASKTLPFGTKLRITNPKNGKSVIVTVNDRGPYVRGRELDLSRGAASAIGILHSGVAKVIIERVK